MALETDLGGVDARGFLLGRAALAEGDSSNSALVDLGGGGVGGGFLDSGLMDSFCVSGFSLVGSLAGTGKDTGLSRVGKFGNISGGSIGLGTIFKPPGGVTGRGFGFGLGFDIGGLLLLLFGTGYCFFTGSVSSPLFSNMEIRAFVDGSGTGSAVRSKLVTEVAALCAPATPPCCLLAVC